MDFINQAATQISDLFKSMSGGARTIAALLFVAIVVSLGFLFNGSFSGGNEYLLGGVGFSAHELPAMEAAFGKANLSGYTVEGNRIRIVSGDKSKYMAALADAGALPSNFGDHLAKALNGNTAFTSRPIVDATLKAATQQELAQIIRKMNGIESAAVLYDTQKRGGLRAESKTTASVSVKAYGQRALDSGQVGTIRHLVASAISGLSPKDVTVADLNSGRVHADSSDADGLGSALDDPYLARKREYQDLIEGKVAAALSYVPGVTVSVNADLSKELRRREQKDLIDPKQTAQISVREETSSSTSTTPQVAGRPGVASQAPNAPAALAQSSGAESTEERSSTDAKNLVSKSQSQIDFAGLTPERVTVSIGVPVKYLVDIWKQQSGSATADAKGPDKTALDAIEKAEVDKIRKHVEPLIPKPVQADPAIPIVTVTTFSNTASPTAADEPLTSKALTWLGNNWTTLGLVALVIASLRMLRSFAMPGSALNEPSLPNSSETLSAMVRGNDEPAPDDEDRPRRLRRKLGSGPSLRDELSEMVKEDPDAAANILRGWIGNPS